MKLLLELLILLQGSLNDVGSVDVFSWISCLDLRTLAVLTNSTLSSSRFCISCISVIIRNVILVQSDLIIQNLISQYTNIS